MKIIYLTNGSEEVHVDDDDFEFLNKYKWYKKKSSNNLWYVARNIRRNGKIKTLRMHREILMSPSGSTVDHIDSNTFNNQKENLELVTRAENAGRRWQKTEKKLPF